MPWPQEASACTVKQDFTLRASRLTDVADGFGAHNLFWSLSLCSDSSGRFCGSAAYDMRCTCLSLPRRLIGKLYAGETCGVATCQRSSKRDPSFEPVCRHWHSPEVFPRSISRCSIPARSTRRYSSATSTKGLWLAVSQFACAYVLSAAAGAGRKDAYSAAGVQFDLNRRSQYDGGASWRVEEPHIQRAHRITVH